MNMSKVALTARFFVDWISCILPWNEIVETPDSIPFPSDVAQLGLRVLNMGRWTPTKPHFGYRLAWKDDVTGVIMQYHPLRCDMGVNLVFTGRVLAEWDWRVALERLNEAGARFTRIDLAVDIIDPTFDLKGLFKKVQNGDYVGRTKRFSFVDSSTGQTMYIGARTSEKFLRVYDKGAEQGEVGGFHFRAELETKGTAADFVGNTLLTSGDDAARRIIAGFFDAPEHNGWASALLRSYAGTHLPSAKKRTDTDAWLYGVVADVLAHSEEINPGFWQRYAAYMNERLYPQV